MNPLREEGTGAGAGAEPGTSGETSARTAPEPGADPQEESETAPEPEPGADTEAETAPEAEDGVVVPGVRAGRAAEAEAGPAPEGGPGPEAVGEVRPESEAGAGPEAAAGVASGTGAETAPVAVAASESVAEDELGSGSEVVSEVAPVAANGRPRPGLRSRRWRWVRRGGLVLVLVVLLPLLVAEAALRVNYMGDPAEGARTRHRDAVWLGHAWVDGRKTDADVAALARRVEDTGIRDLYVHSGPLEHDGTLPASAFPRARWFVAAVHREMPGVRVQAWLGDTLATESPDGLRLEKAATRAAVLGSTRAVLAAGFEGAHFDLEPLHSGDRHYLDLLDGLRRLTHARGAVLSVAAHQIDPLPAFHTFWGATTGHPKWWSQAYFGQVARRVDQIAVMSYDTMQPLQSLYGGYVAEQTSLALEVTPAGTDLLMGLPFYHENRFGHVGYAETVPAAVRGVRLGLTREDADRARFGVALYVDFAATEADWNAYRDDWVR